MFRSGRLEKVYKNGFAIAILLFVLFFHSRNSPQQQGLLSFPQSSSDQGPKRLRRPLDSPDLHIHEMMNLLFDPAQEDRLDFVRLGYQLRFYKKLHNIVLKAQQEKAPSKWTELEKESSRWLGVIDEHLFHWIGPTFHSTLQLESVFKGRGIVVCVYNDYVPLAMGNLQIVRTVLGSELPIEVFYMGDNDLSESNRKILETIPNLTTRNILEIFDDEDINMSGWAIKAFALMASSFQEAILMDADVIFLQKPESLFKSLIYQEKGALFFQDRTMYTVNFQSLKKAVQWIADVLPKPFKVSLHSRFAAMESSHQQESGVVVIDKKKRFTGLLATCLLNVDEVRNVAYSHMYGDKETFWIGFEIVREPYGWNPFIPGAIGKHTVTKDGMYEICSVQMIHVDEFERPVWINGGMAKNKLLGDFSIQPFEEYLLESRHNSLKSSDWSMHGTEFCMKSPEKPNKMTSWGLDVIKKASPIVQKFFQDETIKDFEVDY